MSSRAGIPNGQGVKARLRAFFDDNPDEELTRRDIEAKFGCSKSSMENAIASLQLEGRVESVHVVRARSKGIAS